MDFTQLVTRNRSYRRFDQHHLIAKDILEHLVELARYCPSGANRQALRFICSCSADMNRKIFPTLGWAAYLPDWPGPPEGERPTGYIIILSDPSDWKWTLVDLGIVAQTILLEAVNQGLGGCMIGNIKRESLHAVLDMPEKMEAALVIALGKPVEKVSITDVTESGSIKYYRTQDGVHHVPKRSLNDLIWQSYE